MERTGETQSEAVRNIVLESEQKSGNVTLTPKAPPQHLEDLLGLLGDWRRAFSTAKPRLNIATPATDDARYAEVTKWRAEADRLLAEIPILENVAMAALHSLTSLTPEKIQGFRKGYEAIKKWESGRRIKGELDIANTYAAILDLFHDMGITSEK
jgi:hypothetical protein